VVLQASIAPLASHVSNHAEKFAHVTVKELEIVSNYVLQILHTLLIASMAWRHSLADVYSSLMD
jgi:hypothetical protein